MKDILIVTGTCGVGKSSLCWAWADQRRGAVVHCDSFRTWIRNPSLRRADGYQERFIAKHANALATDYLAMGLDVAIDNVWTPAGIALLERNLGDKGRISVFWLNCSARENRERDRGRSASDVMGSQLDELQKELETMEWPCSVVTLDTSGESLRQTVERVETMLGCKKNDK